MDYKRLLFHYASFYHIWSRESAKYETVTHCVRILKFMRCDHAVLTQRKSVAQLQRNRVFRFSSFKKEIAKHFFCSFVHFKLIYEFQS